MGIEIMKGCLQYKPNETPKKGLKPTIEADEGATTILARCCSDPKTHITEFKFWELSFIDHLFKPCLPMIAPNS